MLGVIAPPPTVIFGLDPRIEHKVALILTHVG
jgi:hypothetical protein